MTPLVRAALTCVALVLTIDLAIGLRTGRTRPNLSADRQAKPHTFWATIVMGCSCMAVFGLLAAAKG